MKANKQEQQKSSNRKAQIESHRKGDKGQQGKHEGKQVGAAAASNKPEKKMRFKINNLVFFYQKVVCEGIAVFLPMCRLSWVGWVWFPALCVVLISVSFPGSAPKACLQFLVCFFSLFPETSRFFGKC